MNSKVADKFIRICPGQYLARNALFIASCRVLQTFKVGKAIDENGCEVPVRDATKPGLVS